MKLHPLKLNTISCLNYRASLNLNGSLFLRYTLYIVSFVFCHELLMSFRSMCIQFINLLRNSSKRFQTKLKLVVFMLRMRERLNNHGDFASILKQVVQLYSASGFTVRRQTVQMRNTTGVLANKRMQNAK